MVINMTVQLCLFFRKGEQEGGNETKLWTDLEEILDFICGCYKNTETHF